MSAEEVVVITGATSGVGRAVARRFARPGVSLGLVARGGDGLEGARREVEAAGGRALTLACDIADPDALDAVAEAVEEAYGPIDIWINNAMTTAFGFFDDLEPAEFRRTTDVTYHGTVWGTRAALARMMPRDRGTIVQVGSALPHQGIPLHAPYCGAKHAIKGLQESVRGELRHRGSHVHLTMVHLPGLDAPQFEHACDESEIAAEAVHWAAHHRRREIFVGAPSQLWASTHRSILLTAAVAASAGAVAGSLARSLGTRWGRDRP